MSTAQDLLNIGFGPPPLATPITAQGPDEFGIPWQNRGLPSGNLNIAWVGWFNSLFGRLGSLPVIQDTRANRANYSAPQYQNVLYRETDSALVYVSYGGSWTYQGGTYARTQAQLAALAAVLTVADNGLRVNVTDYAHMLMWTNPAWGWAPEDPQNAGSLGLFDVAPGAGWKLIDGTGDDGSPIGGAHPIKILKADGTLRNNTTAAAMNAGVYARGAAAYNGAVTAATNPTGPANTGSTAPGNTGAPSATTLVTAGAVAVASSAHVHVEAAHTHTIGAITLAGDPVAFVDFLPYLRK